MAGSVLRQGFRVVFLTATALITFSKMGQGQQLSCSQAARLSAGRVGAAGHLFANGVPFTEAAERAVSASRLAAGLVCSLGLSLLSRRGGGLQSRWGFFARGFNARDGLCGFAE